MKILIVHDRDAIAEAAKKAIEAMSIDDLVVDCAIDVVSARQRLRSKIYDLCVLDVTLPSRRGTTQVSLQNAEDLLRDIIEDESLHAPGDIIGLSNDADALSRIGTSIASNLMALIEEKDDGRWLIALRDKINYVRRSAEARYAGIARSYDVDALIVTALDEEFAPYKKLFEFHDDSVIQGAKRFSFQDGNGKIRRGIAYSIGRMGQHAAASMTQSLVTRYRPKACLMSGICGGMGRKVRLGDVVFFESSIDWDSGKWARPERESSRKQQVVFMARPEPITIRGTQAHTIAREIAEGGLFCAAEALRELASLVSPSLSEIRFHLAPAASGSAVVAEKSVTRRMRELHEGVRAVDMESYGFYHAASYSFVARPTVLCVKSVVDFCDVDKSDNYHNLAARLSAVVVHEILTRRWKFE
jgi:nucleoside phosphorylase